MRKRSPAWFIDELIDHTYHFLHIFLSSNGPADIAIWDGSIDGARSYRAVLLPGVGFDGHPTALNLNVVANYATSLPVPTTLHPCQCLNPEPCEVYTSHKALIAYSDISRQLELHHLIPRLIRDSRTVAWRSCLCAFQLAIRVKDQF